MRCCRQSPNPGQLSASDLVPARSEAPGRASGSRPVFFLWLLVVLALPTLSIAGSRYPHPQGQTVVAAAGQTVPALFVSDIHFDPFHDPGKVRQLAEALSSKWGAILSSPPSPGRRQAFDDIQQECRARGIDTSYSLLRSSLGAMRSSQPDARFVTVSGDLIAHNFPCRFSQVFPGSTPSEYEQFVLKTIRFLMGELRTSFPAVPIYVALGNNDTPCGDDRLDGSSYFLEQAGKITIGHLSSSARSLELAEFSKHGSYSITMAEPLGNTRLIVLDDLFLASGYKTCAGRPDLSTGESQLAWLAGQLDQARQLHQRVWVMAHIPPGISPFSTVREIGGVCGLSPAMSFSSPKFIRLLVAYSDIVRLGIFAHTHMDEMEFLGPEGNRAGASEQGVAVKLVPSITPVDGNKPSFVAADIDPVSSTLRDYRVIVASNATGTDTAWSTEYDYQQTYHLPGFTSTAVKKLMMEFEQDPNAKKAVSAAYIHNYSPGRLSLRIRKFWPQYVCGMAHHSTAAYTACVCSTAADRVQQDEHNPRGAGSLY